MAEKKVTKKKETKVAPKKVAPKKPEVKKVEKVQTEVVKKPKKVENNFWKENSTNVLIAVLCLLLVGNIILVVLGHKVKLKNGSEVIASIKGKDFTAEEVFDELKSKYGSQVLVNFVDEEIADKELTKAEKTAARKEAKEYIESIKSQYEASGYEWETVLSQYGYESEDALINEYAVSVKIQKVISKAIEKDLTDEEINNYYNDKVFGTYTIKHILIIPDTTDEMSDEEKSNAEEAAKATAAEVIEKYANGEAWADLVSAYSEDEGSKDSEGLVENFTYGDVDEAVLRATDALKDGEYTTEPVKSSFGYHVILRVSSTKKPSLKSKKEEIKKALVTDKLNNDADLYSNTIVKIRKDYKLDIKDTVVKKAYEKSING